MITVSQIVQEYGAYYEKAGQNKKRLFSLLMQGSETQKHMSPRKTDDTIYRMGDVAISDLVQPFHKTFSHKGTLTFTPQPIELGHAKVDLDVYPDDIEATWLGFLAPNNLSRKEWPLVRFMLEGYIIPKIKENIELKAVMKGVLKAAPGGGNAGEPEDIYDGIQKKLADGLTAGTINQITGLGALDVNTIFDQVEEFSDKIDQVYQSTRMSIFMSPTWFRAYMRDKRAQGYYQIGGADEINNTVDFTPFRVIPLPSMASLNYIFATPKDNFLYVTKKSINKNQFRIEEAKRCVSIMTDFWEGVGFGINEAVWTTHAPGSGSV